MTRPRDRTESGHSCVVGGWRQKRRLIGGNGGKPGKKCEFRSDAGGGSTGVTAAEEEKGRETGREGEFDGMV